MSEAKKTPFYEKHTALNGKIVDYNGWLLPVQFPQGLVEEVHDTRKRATIFDVSHMGEVSVKGTDAENFLQKILTNDVSRLKDNAIMYSPVCYPDGGVVDDILIYRLSSDNYLLVVNAANTEKDFKWFQENCFGDVKLENLSSQYAQIALQGPNSEVILQKLTDVDLADIKFYRFQADVSVAGVNCIVSRTGYTGENGFEVYCKNEGAIDLWGAVWKEGQNKELSPAGLGARDVLRLEASLPLYGHELSKDITPLQAGLNKFVKLDKPVPFNGQEALKKQAREGLPKKLYGLEMLERGVPREGYTVKSGEEEIGWVSSGSYSPTLEKFIAMAFLDPGIQEQDEEVEVAIRKRTYRAKTIKLPFYRRGK